MEDLEELDGLDGQLDNTNNLDLNIESYGEEDEYGNRTNENIIDFHKQYECNTYQSQQMYDAHVSILNRGSDNQYNLPGSSFLNEVEDSQIQ